MHVFFLPAIFFDLCVFTLAELLKPAVSQELEIKVFSVSVDK